MSRILGSPALVLLLRLKLRGLVRRQWRRLRTPRGFLLTLLGGAALALYFGSTALSLLLHPRPLGPGAAELRVRALGLLLVGLSVSTALTHRGLFLARNECERLFSAPVARTDLVRYRLLASAFRSLLAGLLLGLFSAPRMPSPALALAGIVLAMQTLPVVNQLVAIALAGLELRAARALQVAGSVLLLLVLAGLSGLVFLLATDRDLDQVPGIGRWLEATLAHRGDLFAHPLLARATLPFLPWARMIAAGSAAAFVPWFLVCLALHGALAELCARLPVDFRELSLTTSARVARRLARVRSGGGVAATRASRGAACWRVPWLFGRSPLGAIAWRKTAGMVRKARSALALAVMALLFITVLASLIVDGPRTVEALWTPVLVAGLGTVYLCAGLRFDFREDLERMDVIRAWPLAPAQVFLATLLPEVVLVSVLLCGTVLAQAALAGELASPLVAGIVLALPFVVFAWVALDNAVFLVLPVRFVPGQDGLLQNAGRGMILIFLRSAMVLVIAVAVGLPGLLAWWSVRALGGSFGAGLAAVFAVGVAALAACDALLVFLGGRVLARFDVARDRG